MKKILLILVLGFFLSSCGTTYESFKSEYSNYTYHAYACPANDPDRVDGCGLGASVNSQKEANETALGVCRESFSNCVVIK